MKREGATALRPVAEGDDWATWIGSPGEGMARASHALAAGEALGDDEGCWLVDPLDADGLPAWLEELGGVAGVVVLLDRHTRDADVLASRYDVPVHVPEELSDLAEELDAPVETFDRELPETGYRRVPVVQRRFWTEAALYHPDRRTLVVPEAVGTPWYFRTSEERLGVHPALRLFPPRGALGDLRPDRILCGHGEPVVDDAAAALDDALTGARRRTPRLYAKTLRGFLPL